MVILSDGEGDYVVAFSKESDGHLADWAPVLRYNSSSSLPDLGEAWKEGRPQAMSILAVP
jgi:hypothetical protein